MLPTHTPENQGMEDQGREEERPGHALPTRLNPLDEAAAQEAPAEDAAGPDVDQLSADPSLPIDQWPTQPMPVLGDDPLTFQQGGVVDEALSDAQQATGAGSYFAQTGKLVKSSGIYALASLGLPLVSLLVAPFLTSHLSKTDYGSLAVLTTVISLTAGITQLGLASAFFRSYNYEFTEAADRRAVLATVVALLPLICIPVAITASLFSPILAGLLLRDSSRGGLIVLTAWIVVVQNLTIPGLAWMRAEGRPLFYSLLAIGNALIALCANVLLVGLLHLGIAGALLATGSGYASVALCTLPVILWRARLRVRRDVAWSLLSFGAPQVLSFISFWVLQLSDRYLLGALVSLAQTASYAVAYSLGAVLSTLIISPFQLAWPTTMYGVARRKEAPHIFQLIFRWFSLVLLFVAFGISIAGPLILDVLFPANYRSAAPLISIIAESIVFYGLYIVFMAGASIRRKTWMPAAFTGLAALVNVALNLVLIPLFSSAGAAASTLIAYIVLALVAYLANQRIYPVPYEIKRFVLALLSGDRKSVV